MRVGREGRDTGHAEIPGRHVVAELLSPRQQEATEAAIDVQADAALLGQGADAIDGVDKAVGVVPRAADETDRVVVDQGGHGIDVDDEVGGERGVTHLDAEPVGTLAQRHVSGHGEHDVGHAHTTSLARLLPIGVERMDEAVAATRGDDADRLGIVEEIGRHGDDLAFELRGRGIHVALQDVGMSEVLEDLREEVIVPVITAVETPRDAPRITHGVLGLGHARDVGEDAVAVQALLGDGPLRGHEAPIGEEVVEHPLEAVVGPFAHQSMPFDRRPTARSVSRLASRSAMAWRLSWLLRPVARAISTLAKPSLK